MRREEAALLSVQCTEDGKFGVAAVTVGREVWDIYAVLEEKGIMEFLSPRIHYIHCGRKNGDPLPYIGSISQLTGIQNRSSRYGLI